MLVDGRTMQAWHGSGCDRFRRTSRHQECSEIWEVGELLVTVVLASLKNRRLVVLQWSKTVNG